MAAYSAASFLLPTGPMSTNEDLFDSIDLAKYS